MIKLANGQRRAIITERISLMHVDQLSDKCFFIEMCFRYVEEFHKMTIDDVRAKKNISRPDPQSDLPVPEECIANLSVKLSEVLPHILHAKLMEERAMRILNTPGAVVLSPTMDERDNGKKYLVAGSNKTVHTVTVSRVVKITCDCKGFKYVKICSCSVSVAEKEKLLKELVKGVKVSYRSSLTYPEKVGGSGRKGKQSRRSRIYSEKSQGITQTRNDRQPFTQFWHNNEPLVLCQVTDVPIEKNRCTYCGNEFPRGILSIAPYDIVLMHRERWEYFNRNRKSDADPVYLKSPPNKLTSKYYCVNRDCVLKRFPYFKAELVDILSTILVKRKDGHRKILKEQLGIDV